MTAKESKTPNYDNKWLIVAAAMISIAAGLYAFSFLYKPIIKPLIEVSLPFLIAIVIAFLLDPIVDWLQRRKIPRGIGVGIVGFAFLISFVLIGFLVVPKVILQAKELENNSNDYTQLAQTKIKSFVSKHQSFLVKLNLPTDPDKLADQMSQKVEIIAKGLFSKIANNLANSFGRILWFIIIPLSTLWILKDLDYFKRKIVHLTPSRHHTKLENLGAAIGAVFGNYVRGMFTVALVFSVISCIILSAFHLKFALIFGVLSGLFYLVPYIGVASLALAVIIASLVQTGGQNISLALTMGGYMLFQSFVLFDLVITPKIVGKSVGVHPVLTLFALSLGATFFGIPGMILAVPTIAAVQVAIGMFYPQIYKIPERKQSII